MYIKYIYLYLSSHLSGEGNGNPLQCSCPENPREGGAWWAAIHGVAQSRTRLKRLRRSSHLLSIYLLPFICLSLLLSVSLENPNTDFYFYNPHFIVKKLGQ